MRHFNIPDPSLDSTRQMFKDLENDARDTKIDLGIEIYRDKKGEAQIYKGVKKGESNKYQK